MFFDLNFFFCCSWRLVFLQFYFLLSIQFSYSFGLFIWDVDESWKVFILLFSFFCFSCEGKFTIFLAVWREWVFNRTKKKLISFCWEMRMKVKWRRKKTSSQFPRLRYPRSVLCVGYSNDSSRVSRFHERESSSSKSRTNFHFSFNFHSPRSCQRKKLFRLQLEKYKSEMVEVDRPKHSREKRGGIQFVLNRMKSQQ